MVKSGVCLRTAWSLTLATLAAALLAEGVMAQTMMPPPGYGQPPEQDPFARERLKQCRDLGSFAVVDPPRERSGVISVTPGSSCADLLSLQPNWMPYLQLNVDVGGLNRNVISGSEQGGLGQGGNHLERSPQPHGGWNGWRPHQGRGVSVR
jgi:hypothetical protein